MKDEEIARSLQIGSATVERVRRCCVEEGFEAALGRREQLRRRPKKLDGSGEAHLIALACSDPPEGRASWTLKLLADRLVEREIVASISPETVRQTLKKRTEALAEGVLVYAAPGERGVRVCHGRRAGASMGTGKFWYAWTRPANSRCRRPADHDRPGPGLPGPMITNTGASLPTE